MLKIVRSTYKGSIIQSNLKLKLLPSAWRLGFLATKFLQFLTFFAKIVAIILGKVRKILQDFSRSWKEIQENFQISCQENLGFLRFLVKILAYEVFVKNVSSSLHVPSRFCCEF